MKNMKIFVVFVIVLTSLLLIFITPALATTTVEPVNLGKKVRYTIPNPYDEELTDVYENDASSSENDEYHFFNIVYLSDTQNELNSENYATLNYPWTLEEPLLFSEANLWLEDYLDYKLELIFFNDQLHWGKYDFIIPLANNDFYFNEQGQLMIYPETMSKLACELENSDK